LLEMDVDAATRGEFSPIAEQAPSRRIIRPSGSEPSEVEKVSEGWPDLGDDWMEVRGVAVGGDDTFFYFGDVIDQVRRPPGIRNAKNVAALNVAGESMVPRFEPGELIYIQERLAAPGDDVVVELYPEKEGDPAKSFLKKLVRKTGLRLYCKQHNPPAEIEFDMGEVKTIWRVLTLRDLLG
jgi:phage repressor protein C with HTH and peptisase S24 domain